MNFRTPHLNFDVQFQLNQNKDFAQIMYENEQDKNSYSLSLAPGYEHEIEVVIKGQTTTPAFEDMALEQRNCRLDHAIEDHSHQKIFSNSNCKYECRVKKAFDACHCIPWDFIYIQNDAQECDVFGRTCFFQAMENITHDPDDICGECDRECKKLTFELKLVKSTSLKIDTNAQNGFCNKYLCVDRKG